MKTFTKIFLVIFLYAPIKSFAILDIKITQGIETPIPIAISLFGWSQAGNVPPIDIAEVITNNLKRSGRFDVMDIQDLPQNPTSFEAIILAVPFKTLWLPIALIVNLYLFK